MKKFLLVLGALAAAVCNAQVCEVPGDPPDPAFFIAGPTNTGYTGTLTEYTGDYDIETDGAVLENFIFTSIVDIYADNVTIRNSQFTTSGSYGLRIRPEAGGTMTIEDSEFINQSSSAIYQMGSNAYLVVRGNNIHQQGADAVKPSGNYLIERNWFHHLGSITGSHADGVQMIGGADGIIRENHFDMVYNEPGFNNSQCMIIQTNSGPIDNVLIERNLLNGGGSCVQVRDKGNGYGPPTNVSILDNRFGLDFQFSPWAIDGAPIRAGNVWHVSGSPSSPDVTTWAGPWTAGELLPGQ